MTKHIEGFGGMALALVEAEVGMLEYLHGALERVAQKIEATAKAEIGVYQSAAGPFPAWPELADSTEESKAAAGYPAGAPLLATGDMQASIEHQTEALEAVIGTSDPKAVYHEFGTSRMPSRPFMGPAAFTNKAAIEKLVGAAVVAGLIGEDQIHEALGYDFSTENK